MSLLGALLLAVVGTAVARTPATAMEQDTHTALASNTVLQQNTTSLAAQVTSANSLQSISIPGQLSSGETLPQNVRLYSVDGTVFIEILADGTFALFATETGSVIYEFLAPTRDVNTPLALTMQTDCNWVVHDSLGATLFQSATTAAQYNPSTIGEDLVVTPPCRAVVSGAGGGFVAIIDSFASGGDRSDTALYTRPFVGNGIMLGGQLVPQNVRLYSPDGAVFVEVQGDGNAVLYNSKLKALYGATAATAVTSTGTYGQGKNAPFELYMGTDCNLYLYKNVNTSGRIPANIIFQSYTSGQGTGCQFIVSSQQGGSMIIVDSAKKVLFELPRLPQPAFIPTTPGTLLANQDLPQSTPLYSMDGAAFLVLQGDGNLVLYSVAKVAQYGQGAQSALFYSGTYTTTAPGPYTLTMQGDCNAVVYNGNLAKLGAAAYDAIYQTGTANAGPNPCSLVVGPTSFSVIAANKAVVFNSASHG